MRARILVALLAVIVTAGVLVLKIKTRIDWNKLQSVEVYSDTALGKDFEKMKDVDLQGKARYTLDVEQARALLKRSRTEVQVVTIWKGHKYAIAHFSEGKPLRLKVSNNGGFFFVLNYGRKYEIREADLEAWNKLWEAH